MAETGDKVLRKYENFRGVDFRGEECSLNRSPDCLNVWRDYRKLSCIETRPGLENFYTFPHESINKMMWYGKYLYFVADDGYVYAVDENGAVAAEEIANVGESGMLFAFEGKLYALGYRGYYNIYEDGVNIGSKSVEPYIPTTTIARKPSGGGSVYEDVNLLTGWRYNTFVADGSNTYYTDANKFLYDNDHEVEVWILNAAGQHVIVDPSNYDVYAEDGSISFHVGKVPNPPLTSGQANVKIKFFGEPEGGHEKYAGRILNCSMFQEFDNRLFLSGNPEFPSTVWHSGLHDVSYFSDLDYYVDGEDREPIRSIVAGNNALWVFRNVSKANSGVYYHTPALDDEYGKVYPSYHSSITLGCGGRAVNFNDDIVFFSDRGMEGASTDITTEQFATHRSSLVDRKLISNDQYKNMTLAEYDGYLIVFIGNEAYLADSRAVLQNENHVEYEWYYWNFGDCEVTCATVHDGVLYIGFKKDGSGYIQTITGKPEDGDKWSENGTYEITSYWTTPKDTFGAPNKLKTTNKKGCVVEALGDIDIYVKTDDISDFELIGTATGVEDFFVSRIKRKKFKDLQLKFLSKTGFSLETVSMECFVGGYIKRSGTVSYAGGGSTGGSGNGSGVVTGKDGITLKDSVTKKTYTITVEDGKLTMEQKEK